MSEKCATINAHASTHTSVPRSRHKATQPEGLDRGYEEGHSVTTQRYRVSMTNWPGAPGTMTFYLGTAVTDFSPIRTFLNTCSAFVPNGLSFVFPSSVDQFDETTGTLTSTLALTPLTTVTSAAAAGAYAGSAGALIRWVTGSFINGRRVQGRTYLVPMRSPSFGTDGSIDSTTLTSIQTAAAAMIASFGSDLKVWHRPSPGGSNGSAVTVNSATVPDVAVVMRSRRV